MRNRFARIILMLALFWMIVLGVVLVVVSKNSSTHTHAHIPGEKVEGKSERKHR